MRSYIPTSSDDPNNWTIMGEVLRDFDGDERYLDYTADVSGSEAVGVPAMRYFGSMGFRGAGSGDTKFYTHGDQVGTYGLTTGSYSDGPYGVPAARQVLTAFGEAVASGSNDADALSRYNFCGAFGYESGDPSFDEGFDVLADAGLLHVGARYYSPETGQFVQRDPIGINGTINPYLYPLYPVFVTDSTGMTVWEDVIDLGGVAVGVGSTIGLVSGGETIPGGNLVLVGGVAVGVGCGGNFINRHHLLDTVGRTHFPPLPGHTEHGTADAWRRFGR